MRKKNQINREVRGKGTPTLKRRLAAYYKGAKIRRKLNGRNIPLAKIEDKNIKMLNGFAANATARAYKNAIAVSDEIIKVVDGELIQLSKTGQKKYLKNMFINQYQKELFLN